MGTKHNHSDGRKSFSVFDGCYVQFIWKPSLYFLLYAGVVVFLLLFNSGTLISLLTIPFAWNLITAGYVEQSILGKKPLDLLAPIC
ncbi:hypothetical protein C4D60_Mb07t26700 [Musa balbisiana]|uniref:Uncharacterized protein n=1 Tax=Musa balbisiana TaxID=52838 RepID=A0A4S8JIG5_MUSBA|nr:hypothetical protein C4D60_Mb07t26700 [Musa balbisiana]